MQYELTFFCLLFLNSAFINQHLAVLKPSVRKTSLNSVSKGPTINIQTTVITISINVFYYYQYHLRYHYRYDHSALHGMPARTSDEKGVGPSVRLSVKRVNCDKTEEKSVQVFIPTKDSLVF